MGLYLEEFGKIMKKRFGWLILIGMVVIKLFFGFFVMEDSHNTDFVLEENKMIFLQYESKLRGKLTKEKQKIIRRLIKKQDRANDYLLEQGKRLAEGSITMQDYLDSSIKEREILQKKEVIEVLNGQYQYIQQDKKHRFFVYPNGWINFFQKSGKDFACFLGIFFLMATVFGREFETEVHDLNRVCICGGKKLYSMKWGAALTTAVLFSVLSYLMDLITALCRYGLEGGTYPLQSISLFEDCIWDITLAEAALLVLFLKIIGAVLFTSWMQFCCLCTKKIIPGVVTALFMTAFPYFCVSKDVLYHLPVPVSFFLMDGFLQGVYNTQTGLYDFLSEKEAVILMGSVFLIMAFFIFAGYFFYQGLSFWKYKMRMFVKKLHKKTDGIGIFFLILILSGCGVRTEEEPPVLYNDNAGLLIFENETYIFDTCSIPYIRKEKESGLEESLFLDVFWSEEDYENIKIVYTTEKGIYYIKYSSFYDYDLVYFNLESLENHILYQCRDSQAKGYNYLGLIQEPEQDVYHNIKRSEDKATGFWLDGKYLYIIKGNKVGQINLYTKKEKILVDNAESIACYDGRIYYLTENYELCSYSIEERKTEKLEDYPIWRFKVLEEKLVFFTLDEHVGYCCHDLDGPKLLERNYGMIGDVTERYIYCQKTSETVIAVNYQGEKEREYTFPEKVESFISGKEDDWFCGIIRTSSGEMEALYGAWNQEKQ